MNFFFFSSRRRHTRWPRDWSSDVCSSDLDPARRDIPPDPDPGLPRGKRQCEAGRAIPRVTSPDFDDRAPAPPDDPGTSVRTAPIPLATGPRGEGAVRPTDAAAAVAVRGFSRARGA